MQLAAFSNQHDFPLFKFLSGVRAFDEDYARLRAPATKMLKTRLCQGLKE